MTADAAAEPARFRPIVRAGRFVVAAVIAAAVITALRPTQEVGNFFSFFTIESNLLAIVVFAVGGIVDPVGTRWAGFRGAVTLYMVITGIVYNTLLTKVSVGLIDAWVNDVLHRVGPALLLLDWILFSPWPRLRLPKALIWLLFPLAYFAYSLIRGRVVDWYPYPFLDPRPAGYGRVVVWAVVLAVVMGLLALGVAWIGSRRRRSIERVSRPSVR